MFSKKESSPLNASSKTSKQDPIRFPTQNSANKPTPVVDLLSAFDHSVEASVQPVGFALEPESISSDLSGLQNGLVQEADGAFSRSPIKPSQLPNAPLLEVPDLLSTCAVPAEMPFIEDILPSFDGSQPSNPSLDIFDACVLNSQTLSPMPYALEKALDSLHTEPASGLLEDISSQTATHQTDCDNFDGFFDLSVATDSCNGAETSNTNYMNEMNFPTDNLMDNTSGSLGDLESIFNCLPSNPQRKPSASPFEDLFQGASEAPLSTPDATAEIFANMGLDPSFPKPYAASHSPACPSSLYPSHASYPAQVLQPVESLGASWDENEDQDQDGIWCGNGGEEGQEGEPEVRAKLRAARLARRQERVHSAREEVRAREEELLQESLRREEAEQMCGEKLRSWAYRNKGNIRALLGSMDQVLWESNNWKPLSMTDLISPSDVKKGYRKALLVIHPDKVKQSSDCTSHKMYIADVVFDELKEAW
eukprot:CAMPEP_0196591710 /NCGR_PEP_ID=MMETSP1081-20130531/70645_1 /TAXON_ID=36882 /ORGANISM="Pyramimonas amylifera, Strain CCMP720" /LENGTH=478 /DNA_ID=CAMNT_0041915163 /DNA_START=351 /DNA_END=1784 /DNA_ORIENTATION=-